MYRLIKPITSSNFMFVSYSKITMINVFRINEDRIWELQGDSLGIFNTIHQTLPTVLFKLRVGTMLEIPGMVSSNLRILFLHLVHQGVSKLMHSSKEILDTLPLMVSLCRTSSSNGLSFICSLLSSTLQLSHLGITSSVSVPK